MKKLSLEKLSNRHLWYKIEKANNLEEKLIKEI